VAHPSSRRSITADIREAFLVKSIRSTERHLLNRLVHYQSPLVVIHNSQPIPGDEEDSLDRSPLGETEDLEGFFTDMHPPGVEDLHTSQVLDREGALSRADCPLVLLPLMGFAGLGHSILLPTKTVPETLPKAIHSLSLLDRGQSSLLPTGSTRYDDNDDGCPQTEGEQSCYTMKRM